MSGTGARATMREVAALAGVSLKTVSRVVNAEPGVSPDLRERVTRAVRALDYRPNLAASSLRRGVARTGVLGVLVPDLGAPASAELLATLEEGDFFGEAALLSGEPRNATVVAVDETELYVLGKADFQAVMDSSASFKEQLLKVLFERQ